MRNPPLSGAGAGSKHSRKRSRRENVVTAEIELETAQMEIAHGLPREEAVLRVERLFATAADWDSELQDVALSHDDGHFRFSAKVRGIGISGEMMVGDQEVTILVNLPWIATVLREPAEEHIRKYLEKTLALGRRDRS